MCSVKAGLECLVIESHFLQLSFEIVETSGIRLRALSLARNLRVERNEPIIESAFLLLLVSGHGFVDIDAATVEHVEQYAGFGAFSVGERRAGLVLSHEQLDHGLVGIESVFKEALLVLLTASDLSAQRLDDGDG